MARTDPLPDARDQAAASLASDHSAVAVGAVLNGDNFGLGLGLGLDTLQILG
jgi:hypothetical protein